MLRDRITAIFLAVIFVALFCARIIEHKEAGLRERKLRTKIEQLETKLKRFESHDPKVEPKQISRINATTRELTEETSAYKIGEPATPGNDPPAVSP
jgi:hypothetical protein